MRERYLSCAGGGPAATFGAILLIGAAFAIVIIKVVSPGTWNYLWDRDERKIAPPQYLVQYANTVIVGSLSSSDYIDDKKHNDYANHWVMTEDPSAPPPIQVYSAGRGRVMARPPFRNQGGPFYTYKDLRRALTKHGLSQIALAGTGEIVEARVPNRRNP